MNKLLDAVEFATIRHAGQLRQRAKGIAPLPYIVHPVGVARLVADHTDVDDDVLIAAVLHDVVEDTDTTVEEVERAFGARVAGLVAELTDPPGLKGAAKNASQLARIHAMSHYARIIKLADKTYNVRDIRINPPGWSRAARLGYLEHAEAVVRAFEFGLGVRLVERFDAEAAMTRAVMMDEAAR